MALREWFRPPRHVVIIFLAVAVVSAGALGWLATLLLQQQKTVDTQRRQDRLEQAADRAAAAMRSALAELELELVANVPLTEPQPPGILIVNVAADRMTVRPEGGLLYYPEDLPHVETSGNVFGEAEQAEFTRKDLRLAARLYLKLSTSASLAVRAGAFVRLARVYRKMENNAAALDAYDHLLQVAGIHVAGLPAGLIAREGRAAIFEQTHRDRELRQEAEAFREEVRNGRWQLTKSQLEFYSAEAAKWFGLAAEDFKADARAISRADAAAWLWQNWRTAEPAGRRWMEASTAPVLLMWSKSPDETLRAAIVDAKYLATMCNQAISDPALDCTLTDPEGRVLEGEQPPARFAAVRAASAKAPWSLHIFSASNAPAATSAERRLLLWVLAVLAAVWCAGAYFIMRAVSHEMRVARLQSDFVAAVSHEFRSPLSSLRQISEMLAEDRLTSDNARRESYGVLARESQRLHHLVEDLLDFGRFDSGRAVFHFEPLEVRGFLQVLIADFQQRIAAPGYRVELNLPESDVYVRADNTALSRAIWNLLDNAVKYSPNSQTVWVDVEVTGHRVSIAVRDRGIGIPAGEQREIFEKFVRGSDSKALRIKGTGIGLAMVRHIMQAHGGQILLASEPGQGSRFTMVLDTIARSASAAARSSEECAS